MTKRWDSRLEERIARLPGMWWFDSRKSGDPVSWFVHHPLWTAAGGLLGMLGALAHRDAPALGFFFGALAVLVWYLFDEPAGAAEDWAKWERGELKPGHGPWSDSRDIKGYHFGFMWDHIGDVLGSLAVVVWAGHMAGLY